MLRIHLSTPTDPLINLDLTINRVSWAFKSLDKNFHVLDMLRTLDFQQAMQQTHMGTVMGAAHECTLSVLTCSHTNKLLDSMSVGCFSRGEISVSCDTLISPRVKAHRNNVQYRWWFHVCCRSMSGGIGHD